MNRVEYIMFDNAPKILKESWDPIWPRCLIYVDQVYKLPVQLQHLLFGCPGKFVGVDQSLG